MATKVVIIDDGAMVLENMTKVAGEAGHEVLSIWIIGPHIPSMFIEKYRNDFRQLDNILDTIVAIKSFDPDVIFLDHNLGRGVDFTGEHVFQQLGYPAWRVVGTSNIYQEYCGRRFQGKGDMDLECFQNEFLKIILGT